MSGGSVCRCSEARVPIERRRWRVLQRHCNHSAFNGYHYTPSAYSSLVCMACGMCWRTKAVYVHQLPDRTDKDRINFSY